MLAIRGGLGGSRKGRGGTTHPPLKHIKVEAETVEELAKVLLCEHPLKNHNTRHLVANLKRTPLRSSRPAEVRGGRLREF